MYLFKQLVVNLLIEPGKRENKLTENCWFSFEGASAETEKGNGNAHQIVAFGDGAIHI